jgi:hypothetical protein
MGRICMMVNQVMYVDFYSLSRSICLRRVMKLNNDDDKVRAGQEKWRQYLFMCYSRTYMNILLSTNSYGHGIWNKPIQSTRKCYTNHGIIDAYYYFTIPGLDFSACGPKLNATAWLISSVWDLYGSFGARWNSMQLDRHAVFRPSLERAGFKEWGIGVELLHTC